MTNFGGSFVVSDVDFSMPVLAVLLFLVLKEPRRRDSEGEEITAIVEANAKEQAYDLVFDKSGLSMNAVPFLLHSKDAVDFSNEIIAELNKSAPAQAEN